MKPTTSIPRPVARPLGLAVLALVASLSPLDASDEPAPREAPRLAQPREALLAGIHWGVCYSGFREGQHPDRGDGPRNPSEEEILEDLRILTKAGFRLIRLYDSKENSSTTLRLIREHQFDLKVMLGAWLEAEVNNPDCPWDPEPFTDEALALHKVRNHREVGEAIRLAREYPKIVVAVAVGNEALVQWNDHMVPLESILAQVARVRAAVDQPVTVADNYDWWAKHGAPLIKEVDFISVHIYPVWEGRDIDEAIRFGAGNLAAVQRVAGGKPIVITEAGWATVASEFGERASESKQQRYYRELHAWTRERNITTLFFEAFDEDWKGNPDNPLGAEKHWGIHHIDRSPKAVMRR